MYVVRTEEEIDDLKCKCFEAMIEGGRNEGMTYEQGIVAAIDWLFDDDEEALYMPDPMERGDG